jgi:DNA invertase Pin-like site-specific DNA recombinase
MNHYKNRCVHCGHVYGAAAPLPAGRYNGRTMKAILTEEECIRARRLLKEGTSPKLIASWLQVSRATIYRLSPFLRG